MELVKTSVPKLPRLRPPKVSMTPMVDIYQLIPKGKPCLFWLCNKHSETVISLFLGQRTTIESTKKLELPFPASLGDGVGTLIEGAFTKQCGPGSLHFYRILYCKGKSCAGICMRANLELLLSTIAEIQGSSQYTVCVPYTLARAESLQFSETIARYKVYGVRGITLSKPNVEWQSSLTDTLKAIVPQPNYGVFSVLKTDLPDVYRINEVGNGNEIQTAAVTTIDASTALNKLFRFGSEETSPTWIEDSDDDEDCAESLVMLCRKTRASKWEPVGLA